MKLTQGLHRSALIKAGEVATIFEGRRRTWTELKDRVSRLAAALVQLGLEPGDRVAVIAMNSDLYLETYFAVWWAGGVIVPGNIRWVAAEHIYALEDCDPKILIVDATFAELAASIAGCANIRATIYLGDDPAPTGMISSEALIASAEPMTDRCSHDDTLAAVFYTGGTTGRSKGVMLSHKSLISSFLCLAATTAMSGEGAYIHSAPMFHLADAAMINGMTMLGASHAIIRAFSPAAFSQAVEAERVTDVLLVPTMFAMLREYAETHPIDLSSVLRVAYGASPISETLLRQTMKLFPNASFRQAYGQTELSPMATLLTDKFHRVTTEGKSYLRSAGQPVIGIEVKIVDEQMVERPTGEVGEIAVYSPGAMLGYWNLPELTRQTLVDGWVRTGDAGYMDEEGFLFLVDRVKDMIVSGGENVFSAEVENALAAHDRVAECAVIGVPDPVWGERVHAIVRLSDGASASPDELIDHCRTLIAGYKCPRTVELRTEPLPLSGAGKILKSELRKPYWAQTDRGIG